MAPSGGLAFDNALNSLTGHLLHDHLGLQGALTSHNTVTGDNASITSTILPIQEPEPDAEMRDQEHDSHPQTDKQKNVPSDRNQRDVVKDHRADERPPSAEDKKPNSILDGNERCYWGECGLSFASVDDLMNHLTTDHVGSGKNHYECFWSGCERSGEKGFSSKQKVCRHLQVRIRFSVFDLEIDRGPTDAYRTQAIPMQTLQATFLRGGDAATTYASPHPRKCVTSDLSVPD